MRLFSRQNVLPHSQVIVPAVALFAALVLGILPFAQSALPQIPAVATIYATGITITDACTAWLLIALTRHSRAWPVLLLGCAYLFGACMALLHLLSFPGAVLPGVPAIGNDAAVGWLYTIWRAGFPLLALAAILWEMAASERSTIVRPTKAIVLGCGIVLGFVAMVAWVAASWGDRWLPMVANDRWLPLNLITSWASIVLGASVAALSGMIAGRRDALYLWLCIALIGFTADISLGVGGGARYTLGWYAARASGLLSASSVLLFFLSRFAAQNRRLSETLQRLQERTDALETEAARRQQAEAHLLQSQKMEALGQLTGGIAHDFNNLLQVMGGRIGMLARSITDEPARRQLSAIEIALQRCETLTRQLLSFARRRPVQPATIALSDEWPRLVELIRPSLRGDISLSATVAPDVWPIEADRTELELALLNAAVNARDAMPKGGELSFVIGNATLAPDPVTGGSGGSFVRIAITDTGAGIPPELLSRVFEPFFTTKQPGRGTGLGLSQIYAFAAQCGGMAAIDSAPGRGTTLTIHLPRSRLRASLPAGLETAMEIGTPTAPPRVLLVEDNDAVADVVVAMLDGLDCEVRRAAGSREALHLLESGSFRPGIVLSDIVMPGDMNGLELARALRRSHPELPVLLTSGYSSAVQDALAEGFEVLPKPYRTPVLQQAIRRVAAAAGAD